jgi:enoyl-[acyl-carrier-protein] reductase (NADH)
MIGAPMGQAELDGPAGQVIRSMVEGCAERRVGTAQEVGEAMALVAGPEASVITGNVLFVHGGTIATQRSGMSADRLSALWGARR